MIHVSPTILDVLTSLKDQLISRLPCQVFVGIDILGISTSFRHTGNIVIYCDTFRIILVNLNASCLPHLIALGLTGKDLRTAAPW